MIRNIFFIHRLVLLYKHKSIFIFIIFLTPVSLYPIYAAEPLEQFTFQGILKDTNGYLITATKDITLQIYTVFTDGSPVWSEDYDDVSVSDGLFALYAGSQNAFSNALNFTNALYLELIIKDSDGANAEILFPRLQIGAVPFALSASRASADFDLNKYNLVNGTDLFAFFHNKTTTTYNGNLVSNGMTGYLAGNDICNTEFSGTHMCTEAEIILTLNEDYVTSTPAWSGTAWVITGGTKYSSAEILLVNDCNGFTHGIPNTYLGSYWQFSQTGGGVGSVAHCASIMQLACCTSGGP